MKKFVKIVLIILGVLVLLIALDTIQAKVFDNSPIMKIRENLDGGSADYIDKGLFVDHYKCDNGDSTTVWKNAKYTCSLKTNAKEENDTPEETELSCLENLLGGYIVSENTSLVEEKLSSIIDVEDDLEDAILIRGKNSNTETGISVIIKTEDDKIISELDKYFNKNYAGYKSFVSGDYNIYLYNKSLSDKELDNVKTQAAKCLTK